MKQVGTKLKTHLFALGAVLFATGCGRTESIWLGSAFAASEATPNDNLSNRALSREELADKQFRDVCARTATTNIGATRSGTGAPRAFSTQRAMIMLVKPSTNKQALVDSLKKQGMKLAADTDNGEPECLVHQSPGDSQPAGGGVNGGDKLPTRAAPPQRMRRVLVEYLTPPPPSSASPDLRDTNFCGQRDRGVMDFVDHFNKPTVPLDNSDPLKGARLAPDFPTTGFQLLDASETSASDNPDLDSAATAYWRLMDLFRAWQLTQIAVPAQRRVVRAAVVDQGFNTSDHNITWNQHEDTDPNDQVFGLLREPGMEWHGANCGSALNATVKDGLGASGSALLGAASVVPCLTTPRPMVQSTAAQLPDTSPDSVIQFIECSIWKGGADVVSVSRGTDCGTQANCEVADAALADTLEYAAKNSASVFFAAGQSSFDLEPSSSSNPPHYAWGCQTKGALCVGGLSNAGKLALIGNQFSNYGSSVSLWGPAEAVPVDGTPPILNGQPLPNDPSATETRSAWGTSLATPFVAGIVALSEAVWGKTYNNAQLAKPLANAALPSADKGISGILQAYQLMRVNPDGRPTPIVPDKPSGGGLSAKKVDGGGGTGGVRPEPSPDQIFTLHKVGDVDPFLILQSTAGPRKVRIKYLADAALGNLQAELWLGTTKIPSTDGTPDGGANCGTKTLVFDNLPSGAYVLRVSATGKLTTGYTVDSNYVAPLSK